MAKISKASIGLAALGMAALIPVSGAALGGVPEASAACALGWERKTDDASWYVSACDGSSSDGTFISKIADDQTITVTLNNYKGGPFTLELSGTGIPLKKIKFNLVGDNEITAENGIGFLTGTGTPMEFTGEGSLRLKALVPVLAHNYYVSDNYQETQVADLLKDYAAYWSEHGGAMSEITIKPTVKTETPTEKPEEKPEENPEEKPDVNQDNEAEKPEDKPEETEKTVWTPEMIAIHAAAAIYIILSVAGYILLGIRKIVRKHRSAETKKIVIEENEIVDDATGDTEVEKTKTVETKKTPKNERE